MHTTSLWRRIVTACLPLLMAATTAGAAELIIGLGSDVTTMDPHFANISSNNDVSANIFEQLVGLNGKNVLVPKLAESWTTIDPLTWEFKLRRSAKFHDGSDVTAEDVVYSLDRPATLTGYPDGFALTIHGTNDRYVNDAKILQTIAQMLTRVGIVTKVDSMPVATFFGRASKREFSVLMAGWGGGSGHPDSYMKALIASYDAKIGFGGRNDGRYSNPRFDALVVEAEATIDPAQQERLWQQAATISMADQAVLPLHNQINMWAARKGYTLVPRVDESTPAFDITITK